MQPKLLCCSSLRDFDWAFWRPHPVSPGSCKTPPICCPISGTCQSFSGCYATRLTSIYHPLEHKLEFLFCLAFSRWPLTYLWLQVVLEPFDIGGRVHRGVKSAAHHHLCWSTKLPAEHEKAGEQEVESWAAAWYAISTRGPWLSPNGTVASCCARSSDQAIALRVKGWGRFLWAPSVSHMAANT